MNRSLPVPMLCGQPLMEDYDPVCVRFLERSHHWMGACNASPLLTASGSPAMDAIQFLLNVLFRIRH